MTDSPLGAEQATWRQPGEGEARRDVAGLVGLRQVAGPADEVLLAARQVSGWPKI